MIADQPGHQCIQVSKNLHRLFTGHQVQCCFDCSHADQKKLPPVPYADLLRYTASADVGIISTQNLCLNNWFCMPNKLFEYIQAGIPILCNNLHDCEIIIEDYGIGRIIPEYTQEHLTAQLFAMHTEDRARYTAGLKKAQSAFHWDQEAEKLRTIYGPLTSI